MKNHPTASRQWMTSHFGMGRGTACLAAAAAAAALALMPGSAFASGGGEAAGFGRVMLGLAVILAGAKLAGDLAARLGQPAVLGELGVGVLLGSLPMFGIDQFSYISRDPVIGALAQLGIVILLFESGLESTIAQMARVGTTSFWVATVGVVTPFLLGWGVGALLLPRHSVYVHVFLGAMLTATSVGITARVFGDLGRTRSPEARVILGAAVIDDVMGLVILAVVGGFIAAASAGAPFSAVTGWLVLAKAMGFLFGSLALGVWLSPRMFRLAARLRGHGILLATALAFCFLMAWLANLAGLAPIVGAYGAGLILEAVHYKDFRERGEHQLEELIRPISTMFSPVFFVLMGMKVDLGVFEDRGVLALAAALTLAAVAGKQACALVVPGRMNRLAIGIGMIPRGEVGLIFAGIGLGLSVAGERIVDEATYSAAVIMVLLSTLMTPPLLRWALEGGGVRRRG